MALSTVWHGCGRRYGEYMAKHDFRWAVVVLFHQRPTRQAMRAVAALLPKYFVEFVYSEDLTDWTADRPGYDYGPRWEGDPGIRGDADKRRRCDGDASGSGVRAACHHGGSRACDAVVRLVTRSASTRCVVAGCRCVADSEKQRKDAAQEVIDRAEAERQKAAATERTARRNRQRNPQPR
jgi:hypothetical protein